MKLKLIEQLNETNIDNELLKHRLKKREDFWIKKLRTLQSHGFNIELNFPNLYHFCISCASVSLKVILKMDIRNTTSHCLIPDVKFVIHFFTGNKYHFS